MADWAAMSVWELDFYSRPLLDENGKRIWELLVCDASGTFRQQAYCPNAQANSVWLREQLQAWLELAPSKPTLIRTFRERVFNIVKRAAEQVDVPCKLSRRVSLVARWLQVRSREVYPQETDYTYAPEAGSIPISMERPAPLPLPDVLQPERWAFVTLPLADLYEADSWPKAFGETLPLKELLPKPPSEAKAAGVILFSQRALPIAAWMTGVEPAYLKAFGGQNAGLVLESGSRDRQIVARFTTEALRKEGTAFEDRKLDLRGIHFLAVQTSPEAQEFAGLWLLQELDLED